MCCQGAVAFAIVHQVAQSPLIETFVDIPRTYHLFSFRHEVKSIHDIITYYSKCMLYINFEFGNHFCHFDRGADLETLRLFLSGSFTYYSLSYTQNRLPRITV
jgi:hypothetical protein